MNRTVIHKIKALFFYSLILLFLFSCNVGGGGDSIPPPYVVKVPIDSEGNINYTGSGDFSGIVIKGSGLTPVFHGILEIRRMESPSGTGEYIPSGYTYEIALYDRSGKRVSDPGGAIVLTIPYNASLIQNQGIDPASLVVLKNGGTILKGTVSSENACITVVTPDTAKFVAAYRHSAPVIIETPIPLIGLGYERHTKALSRGHYFIDKKGNKIPDIVRGIKAVQTGERVILIARLSDDTGYNYTGYDWHIAASPPNSSTSLNYLTDDRREVEFRPDRIGTYTIRLTARRAFGGSDEGEIVVRAGKYTYINTSSGTMSFCELCHSGNFLPQYGDIKDMYGRPKLRDLAGAWKKSKHGRAFENLSKDNKVIINICSKCHKDDFLTRNNPVCLNCHTTGFLFVDRNGNGEDDFPNAQGYDDLIVDWNNAASGVLNSHLRGVTCEACHGPGGDGDAIPASSGIVHDYRADLSGSVCFVCHDLSRGSSGHSSEWPDEPRPKHFVSNTVGNGIVAITQPCLQCHVGQAFLYRIINKGKKLSPGDIKNPSGVTCAVCHDPHGETMNPYYLRVYGETSLIVGGKPITVDAGMAASCYNCHNANNSLPSVGTDIHGNEAEMIEGVGGFTYNEQVGRILTHGQRIVKDKCVVCHMTSEGGITHKWALSWQEGGGLVYNTAGCTTSGCHGSGTGHEFSTTGDRFDYKGKRTEVRGLLTQLQARINQLSGHSPDSPIKADYTIEDPLTGDKLLAVNRAAYNYLFVLRDGSFGIHNYPYAQRLLNASIADLGRY